MELAFTSILTFWIQLEGKVTEQAIIFGRSQRDELLSSRTVRVQFVTRIQIIKSKLEA